MTKNKFMTTIGVSILLMLVFQACTPVAAEVDTALLSPNINEGDDVVEQPQNTETPLPTETLEPTVHPTEEGQRCDDPFEGQSIRFRPDSWELTDFCKHSVDYSEFLSGGPPPDGIPAIDEPVFESVAEANEWIGVDWPVLYYENNGDARVYPLAILMWHEIVNDVVGGKPVALTFCPLCNATIGFERTLSDGTVLDFGTSGNLRNSDLVMYDRQTQSWWQQFTGESIVGFYTGTSLAMLATQIISWGDFVENYSDGLVLSRETGYSRSYGRNPYVGYDNVNTNPFLFDGELDGRLPATARVVAVEIDENWKAYPFQSLEAVGIVNDTVGAENIVVFWKPGTVSALDSADFDDARDIGSTVIFSSDVDGQVLTFELSGEYFTDLETGSTWNTFGKAISGPLQGSALEQIISAEHFWFAWAAFRPETVIWEQ